MLGDDGRARIDSERNRILPNEAYGLKVMSIGFVLDPEKPMIVRGPIVHTAVRQFLGDVEWGELDYLVVDLPPGTGDVALSLAQFVPVTGAVVVSTPQDVSLIDVQKAVNMFRTLKIPVLGLVENMSFYVCPECGHRDEIFGHGGAKTWAEKERIPFLGGVPAARARARRRRRGQPRAVRSRRARDREGRAPRRRIGAGPAGQHPAARRAAAAPRADPGSRVAPTHARGVARAPPLPGHGGALRPRRHAGDPGRGHRGLPRRARRTRGSVRSSPGWPSCPATSGPTCAASV